MEVRPTFFSISGFLIPGIVFFTLTMILGHSLQGQLLQITDAAVSSFAGTNAATGALFSGVLLFVGLSLSFVVGSVVSELFHLCIRYGFRKRFFNRTTNEYSKRLFAQGSLKQLLINDLDCRETFAYQQTCGLDLHWFAGRVRMMGASGLACCLAGSIGFFLGATWSLTAAVFLIGLLTMGVAIYRARRFDEYITATAAIAFWSERSKILSEEL
jgi:hypothetical protein